MKEKKYYPEVRVRLILNEGDVISRNSDSTPNFSEDFLLRMNKKVDEFKVLIEHRVHQLQAENSLILFEQFAIEPKDWYIVRITAKDFATELDIANIIEQTVKGIRLELKMRKYQTEV